MRLIRLTYGLAYFANKISRSRGCIAAIDWMMGGPISVILSIRCSPIRIDYASAWTSVDWRDLQRIIVGTIRNCGVDFHAELSRLERPTARSSPIKNAHANRRGATAGSRNEGSADYGSRLPQIYSLSPGRAAILRSPPCPSTSLVICQDDILTLHNKRHF